MVKLQGLLGLAWDCKMGVQSISGGSHGSVVDPYTTMGFDGTALLDCLTFDRKP